MYVLCEDDNFRNIQNGRMAMAVQHVMDKKDIKGNHDNVIKKGK